MKLKDLLKENNDFSVGDKVFLKHRVGHMYFTIKGDVIKVDRFNVTIHYFTKRGVSTTKTFDTRSSKITKIK